MPDDSDDNDPDDNDAAKNRLINQGKPNHALYTDSASSEKNIWDNFPNAQKYQSSMNTNVRQAFKNENND